MLKKTTFVILLVNISVKKPMEMRVLEIPKNTKAFFYIVGSNVHKFKWNFKKNEGWKKSSVLFG